MLLSESYPSEISWNSLRGSLLSKGASASEIETLLFIIDQETFHDDFTVQVPGLARGYFGIGQFSKATWEAVSSVPFSSTNSISDQLDALRVLTNRNENFHRRHFPAIGYSKEVAYLYHNQGAPSAKSFLLSKELTYPNQSTDAREIFRRIAAEV